MENYAILHILQNMGGDIPVLVNFRYISNDFCNSVDPLLIITKI